jgi:hypothetical protein
MQPTTITPQRRQQTVWAKLKPSSGAKGSHSTTFDDVPYAESAYRGWDVKDWTSSDDRVRGGKSQVCSSSFCELALADIEYEVLS